MALRIIIKKEINLEEVFDNNQTHSGHFNVFTGEWEDSASGLTLYFDFGNSGYWYLRLIANSNDNHQQWSKALYNYASSDYYYESTAMNLVDSLENVVTFPDAYLPECSAYYGWLSEDHKTFISYYNLKSDGALEYVDSIKQGNAVIPLKDTRVPDSAVADAGKVVKVSEDGSYELGEAGGGGSTLYKHELRFDGGTPYQSIIFFSSSSTAITSIDNTAFQLIGDNIVSLLPVVSTIKATLVSAETPEYSLHSIQLIGFFRAGSFFGYDIDGVMYYTDLRDIGTFISDTVTEL